MDDMKKLTVRVKNELHAEFISKCKRAGFRANDVLVQALKMADTIIDALNEAEKRRMDAEKLAELNRLADELGMSVVSKSKSVSKGRKQKHKADIPVTTDVKSDVDADNNAPSNDTINENTLSDIVSTDEVNKNDTVDVKEINSDSADRTDGRRPHTSILNGETVTWHPDNYSDGYYCITGDGVTHKKNADGNVIP